MSSSRALTLRKLFVVEHTKPMGNAYRDTIERALAARLKQPNDALTSYEDYEVTYHREMLPDEVKVTEYNFDTLPRLKSWDSTSTRPLADPVLRLSVTAWCPIRESIFTQGSPFELIPYGIY